MLASYNLITGITGIALENCLSHATRSAPLVPTTTEAVGTRSRHPKHCLPCSNSSLSSRCLCRCGSGRQPSLWIPRCFGCPATREISFDTWPCLSFNQRGTPRPKYLRKPPNLFIKPHQHPLFCRSRPLMKRMSAVLSFSGLRIL